MTYPVKLRIIQGMKASLRFKLPDGKRVEGDTYAEIVQAMADEKMSTPRTLRTYRRAVAKRISRMLELDIPWDTDESFITAMVEHNMMRKVR